MQSGEGAHNLLGNAVRDRATRACALRLSPVDPLVVNPGNLGA